MIGRPATLAPARGLTGRLDDARDGSPPVPPGPPALPLLGHLPAFQRDRLGFLTRVAAEHGDVACWRIGPYRVWQLSHPELVGDVLVTHADRFAKSPVLQRARVVLGDGLLTAEGEAHLRRRRLLQTAFQRRRVADYAATMTRHAARTADGWVPRRPVDVHAHTVRITLAVAGETLLGTGVDADVDVVDEAIADLLAAYRLAFVPFGWRLHALPVGPARRLRRGRAALDALVDRIVAQRRVDPGPDLLSALLEPDTAAQAGAEPLSAAEIRDEAVTLLLAGHETTANALAFACHLLAVLPDVAERLHAELDAVLGDRDPDREDVLRLPVTRSVIGEALRLFPPSWAMARQAVEPHDVAGYRIEPGDVVVLPQWVVHRDPRWWPRPQRCEPERWAGHAGSGDAGADRPRRAFFAFGAGARQCLGERFAWTEATLALAVLARRWHLEVVAGAPVRLDPLITLRPRDGVWLRPVPRRAA